ncbi:hypothetical protein Efla_006589 [Eimeria flavescens]
MKNSSALEPGIRLTGDAPRGDVAGSSSSFTRRADLDDLCEWPGWRSSASEGGPSSKGAPGFFSGLLLRAEGSLRVATNSVTNALGAYTLPCLFVGGGLLGVCTATVAFRSRMRISSLARSSSVASQRGASRPSREAAAAAAAPPSSSSRSSSSASGASDWQAARAPSVLAAEMRRTRRAAAAPWEADEAEADQHSLGLTAPSAADLFTQKELATLFLLPASVILAVLGGSWLFLKHITDIRSAASRQKQADAAVDQWSTSLKSLSGLLGRGLPLTAAADRLQHSLLLLQVLATAEAARGELHLFASGKKKRLLKLVKKACRQHPTARFGLSAKGNFGGLQGPPIGCAVFC